MATKSTPRVLGGERRRRAPGADGPLVNASDHAARWYGVHCSPPLAPADQGDRGEDGCRAGAPNGRVWTAGVRARSTPLVQRWRSRRPDRSRPAAWPCGGSERATGLDWGQPVIRHRPRGPPAWRRPRADGQDAAVGLGRPSGVRTRRLRRCPVTSSRAGEARRAAAWGLGWCQRSPPKNRPGSMASMAAPGRLSTTSRISWIWPLISQTKMKVIP